jgi:hypothetical protein
MSNLTEVSGFYYDKSSFQITMLIETIQESITFSLENLHPTWGFVQYSGNLRDGLGKRIIFDENQTTYTLEEIPPPE